MAVEFLEENAIGLLLVFAFALILVLLITYFSGDMTSFLRDMCYSNPSLPFCKTEDADPYHQLVAEYSAGTLGCAMNAVITSEKLACVGDRPVPKDALDFRAKPKAVQPGTGGQGDTFDDWTWMLILGGGATGFFTAAATLPTEDVVGNSHKAWIECETIGETNKEQQTPQIWVYGVGDENVQTDDMTRKSIFWFDGTYWKWTLESNTGRPWFFAKDKAIGSDYDWTGYAISAALKDKNENQGLEIILKEVTASWNQRAVRDYLRVEHWDLVKKTHADTTVKLGVTSGDLGNSKTKKSLERQNFLMTDAGLGRMEDVVFTSPGDPKSTALGTLIDCSKPSDFARALGMAYSTDAAMEDTLSFAYYGSSTGRYVWFGFVHPGGDTSKPRRWMWKTQRTGWFYRSVEDSDFFWLGEKWDKWLEGARSGIAKKDVIGSFERGAEELLAAVCRNQEETVQNKEHGGLKRYIRVYYHDDKKLPSQYYFKENDKNSLWGFYPDGVETFNKLAGTKTRVTACSVHNFRLPQQTTDWERFIKGYGDPLFLLYYESLPVGVSQSWSGFRLWLENAFDLMDFYIVTGVVWRSASTGAKELVFRTTEKVTQKVIGQGVTKEAAEGVVNNVIKAGASRQALAALTKKYAATGTALAATAQVAALVDECMESYIVKSNKLVLNPAYVYYTKNELELYTIEEEPSTGVHVPMVYDSSMESNAGSFFYMVSPCYSNIGLKKAPATCGKMAYDIVLDSMRCDTVDFKVSSSDLPCRTYIDDFSKIFADGSVIGYMLKSGLFYEGTKAANLERLRAYQKTGGKLQLTDPITGIKYVFHGSQVAAGNYLEKVEFTDSTGLTRSWSTVSTITADTDDAVKKAVSDAVYKCWAFLKGTGKSGAGICDVIDTTGMKSGITVNKDTVRDWMNLHPNDYPDRDDLFGVGALDVDDLSWDKDFQRGNGMLVIRADADDVVVEGWAGKSMKIGYPGSGFYVGFSHASCANKEAEVKGYAGPGGGGVYTVYTDRKHCIIDVSSANRQVARDSGFNFEFSDAVGMSRGLVFDEGYKIPIGEDSPQELELNRLSGFYTEAGKSYEVAFIDGYEGLDGTADLIAAGEAAYASTTPVPKGLVMSLDETDHRLRNIMVDSCTTPVMATSLVRNKMKVSGIVMNTNNFCVSETNWWKEWKKYVIPAGTSALGALIGGALTKSGSGVAAGLKWGFVAGEAIKAAGTTWDKMKGTNPANVWPGHIMSEVGGPEKEWYEL